MTAQDRQSRLQEALEQRTPVLTNGVRGLPTAATLTELESDLRQAGDAVRDELLRLRGLLKVLLGVASAMVQRLRRQRTKVTRR